MLEGLRRGGSLELLGVADGAGLGQVLVPAAMIEVVVRVNDVVDVLRTQAQGRELAGYRLRLRLDRLLERQHALDMIEVVAGIEDEPPVLVFDQHGVTGKAEFAPRPTVPERMEAVDNERSTVE